MGRIYIRSEYHGLQFEWDGAHTVNVQALDDASQDLGRYTIVDATREAFEESVTEYLSARGES